MRREAISPTDAVAINAVLFAVRQAADVICDRRALALIVAALLGERRFGGFMERTGMASRVVTLRLRTLEALGLFVRMPYNLRPLRHEYRLSVMGQEFVGIVLQMLRWEQNWAEPDNGQTHAPIHASCGNPLRPELRCRACGTAASVRDVDLGVSRAQLRKVPVKQTLHRRGAKDGTALPASGGLLNQSLDVFGDKWTVEIVMCAFFRVRRFNDFRVCTGIAANILQDRLERLITAGVFCRNWSPDDASAREYRLTAKGVDLFGTLIALQDWADAWVNERYRSPVRIVHRDCGEVFHVSTLCAACGQDVCLAPFLELARHIEPDAEPADPPQSKSSKMRGLHAGPPKGRYKSGA